MSTATVPSAAVADLEQIRSAYRLLRITNSLPPTGAASIAWKSAGTLFYSDLHALSVFGDDQLVANALDELPADVAALHRLVHRVRPELGASVITRPRWLTAWALAGKDLPLRYSPILRATDATELQASSAQGLEDLLRRNPTVKAVLLAQQGVLVLGKDITSTTRLLLTLEETAHLTLDALPLGGPQPFPDDATARTARGIAGAGL